MATSTPTPALHNQENMLTGIKLYAVIATLGIVNAVTNMDTYGISTILPTIAADLHAENTVAWAGISSLIAITVFSVLYGRLSDIFGRRTLFVTACLGMSLADLCCGFAVDGPMLYAFRALAGISAGGIGAMSIIVATDIVSLSDGPKYQGICYGFMVVGNVIAPFISAALAEHATWRSFFWLLSPLSLICAALSAWLLPTTSPTDSLIANLAKVDWFGSLTSTSAIVCFLVPLTGAGSYYAWDSALVISMLAVGLAAFLGFLLWEGRYARLPNLPLSIFRAKDVSALAAQCFFLGWVYQIINYFIPLYIQNLRGWSPNTSAAYLTAVIGIQVLCAPISGQIISRKKHYGWVVRGGLTIATLGSSLMVMFDGKTPPGVIIVALLVFGIGCGVANQPMTIALQAHTPMSQRAVVVSCRGLFRFLGAAIGMSVAATVLQQGLKSALPSGHKHIAESVYSLPPLTAEDRTIVVGAYTSAMRNVFVTNVAVMGLSLLCCLFWKDNGLVRPTEDREGTILPLEGTGSQTTRTSPSLNFVKRLHPLRSEGVASHFRLPTMPRRIEASPQ